VELPLEERTGPYSRLHAIRYDRLLTAEERAADSRPSRVETLQLTDVCNAPLERSLAAYLAQWFGGSDDATGGIGMEVVECPASERRTEARHAILQRFLLPAPVAAVLGTSTYDIVEEGGWTLGNAVGGLGFEAWGSSGTAGGQPEARPDAPPDAMRRPLTLDRTTPAKTDAVPPLPPATDSSNRRSFTFVVRNLTLRKWARFIEVIEMVRVAPGATIPSGVIINGIGENAPSDGYGGERTLVRRVARFELMWRLAPRWIVKWIIDKYKSSSSKNSQTRTETVCWNLAPLLARDSSGLNGLRTRLRALGIPDATLQAMAAE
jgi:hypothetical protein